jgi:hypothetical protein
MASNLIELHLFIALGLAEKSTLKTDLILTLLFLTHSILSGSSTFNTTL